MIIFNGVFRTFRIDRVRAVVYNIPIGGDRMEYDKLLKERNHYIAKQNDLIQRSRYEMTSQQQKVLLYFISKIKPEDKPDQLYTLTISDICQVCGFRTDGGYYFESIKQDLTAIDKVFAWIKTREGGEIRFRWFNVLFIHPGSSAVSLSFHSSVQPYLFNLHEQYTQYSFVNILGLKSKYAIRLYEFISSVNRERAVVVPLAEFRERMGIPNEGT